MGSKHDDKHEKILVNLQNATIVYDGMGEAIAAFFDVDDEALIPVLQYADIKKRPSEICDILKEGEKLHEMAEDFFKEHEAWFEKRIHKVVKCGTCDLMFEPVKELHYIAEESNGSLFAPSSIQYDAYDCPRCGSQKIIKERKAKSE
ncbi:MAG: hypothetical protein RBT15_04740 [Gudongella sp.]|jgi:DNA-directed RNA polymerase subunit RPC12/RpoP|nr:hypothetical protein [Gudongella sp.]